MNINVENDAMLERNNDSIYATKFYVMQKQIDELRQENKQLKEQLSVVQTNEETFRLEMEDITQILGLDEDTLFDDVKVCVKNLKNNWNKLKEYISKNIIYDDVGMKILDPSPLEDYIQELEQGSDCNE